MRARTAPQRPRREYVDRIIPVLRMIDIGMLTRATLNGAELDARLVDAISDFEIELTMDGASQLTVTIEDPDTEILRSDLLAGRIDLDIPGAGRWRMNLPRDVGSLSLAGSTTHLRFWDLGSAALQEQFTPIRKSARNMDLYGWVNFLAREVSRQITLGVEVPAPGEVPHLERETTRDRVGRGSAAAGGGRVVATSGWAPRAAAQVRVKGGAADREQLRVMDAVFTEAVRHDPPALAMVTLAALVTVECEYYNKQGGGYDSISYGVIQNIPRADGTGSMGADGPFRTPAEALDIAYSVRSALLPPGPTSAGGLIRVANQQPDIRPGLLADTCVNGLGVGDPGYVSKVDASVPEAKRNIELWSGRSFDGFRRGGGIDGRTDEIRYRPAAWTRGTDTGREGSWKTLARYAEQLGRRRFIAGPTTRLPRLVMAQDQQLILATPHIEVSLVDDDILTAPPQIEIIGRERLEQVELQVLADAWSAPPGAVADLINAGPLPVPWLVLGARLRAGDPVATVTLTQPMTRRQPDPARSRAARRRRTPTDFGGGSSTFRGQITIEGGARGIVDQAAALAIAVGGDQVYVGSDYRQGDTVGSGAPSDHSGNDAYRAARDIGVRGFDLLVGPPQPQLDQAVVAIGEQLGRSYGNGTGVIIDTFTWHGFRVQIIWRTPLYGGHMGHIHIGVRGA